MVMVKAQLRPLGFGNTHTADPPRVVGCNPHCGLRRFRNAEIAGLPRKATNLGLNFAILRSKAGRAAVKSSLLRWAALTVGRATAEVIPQPRSSSRCASCGSSCLEVKPARYSTRQKRFVRFAKMKSGCCRSHSRINSAKYNLQRIRNYVR